MRALLAGFSLVGLLIAVAIMLLAQSAYLSGTGPAVKKARTQAEQIAGTANDIRSIDSAVLTPQQRGSTTTILVSSVIPGGPLANYGLQDGDHILEVGPFKISDDPDTAKAMIYEAPQRLMPIVLIRNNQRLTLTSDTIGHPAVANPTPAGTSSPPRSGSNNPLMDQINALPGLP